jgi:hypothetical protein
MAETDTGRARRLDERRQPGWSSASEALLRFGGLAVAALLLWLGFITGGFFMLLTGVLAAISAVGGWLLGNLVRTESWYERPNARPLTFAIVIGFPILLIAISQIAGPLLTPPPTTSAQREGTLQAEVERVESLSVDPRIQTMQLTINITGMGGNAVRWFLSNPSGQSMWSGRTDAVGVQQSETIDANGGEWQLHLTSEGGPARYVLDWTGSTSSN